MRAERAVLVGLGDPEMTEVMEVTGETMARMVLMVWMERPEVAVTLVVPATTVVGRVPVNTPPNMEAVVHREEVGKVPEPGVSTGMRVDLYTLKTIN